MEIVVVAIDVYTFQVMAVAAEKVDKEAAQKASAEKTDAIALNMQMTISRKLWMPWSGQKCEKLLHLVSLFDVILASKRTDAMIDHEFYPFSTMVYEWFKIYYYYIESI